MQSWNELLGATQFQSTITSGTPSDGNRINEIAFGSNVFGRAFEGNTVAVTTTWSRGNERTEGDIIFNSGRTWDSYRGNTRSGVVDIRRVALHELGHALGLDHPDQAGQVVTAIMNSTTSNLDALSADDTTGGQNLYGPPGAPPNNNFANATLLTGTAISVTGYNTLATKETGEPNHADNTGGHSVWWRWTAPASGTVSLNTRNSFYDTTLAVYTGNTVNALTPIASDDDIVDGVVQASELTFTAIAGTTYRIALDGFDERPAHHRAAPESDGHHRQLRDLLGHRHHRQRHAHLPMVSQRQPVNRRDLLELHDRQRPSGQRRPIRGGGEQRSGLDHE
jgi:hypothetical protein